MEKFIALLASGIALGCVYALGALGFLILYKATKIINFAQGDLMTLGVYVAYWATTQLHLPVVAAYLLSVAILFVVGVFIEKVAYTPFRKRPVIAVVMSTFAAAIILRAGIGLWQGTQPINLPSPVPSDVITIGGAAISYQRILIFVATAVIVVLLMLLFSKTSVGRNVRALAADREAAQLSGIQTNRLSMLAFGLSAAISALAGVLIAPLAPVDLHFGFGIMLGSFAAAILAGFGSVGGVVIAGLLLGIANQTLGGYFLRDYKDAYPFILMIAVIALRPQGLFSRPERARL